MTARTTALRLFSPLILALLAGCIHKAEYAGPPQLDLGQDWILPPPASPAQQPWSGQGWAVFGDPRLNALVEDAATHNLDLATLRERLTEARALLDRARAGHMPVAAAKADVLARQQSENGPLPIGRIPGLERDQTIHEGAVALSWELDLFGRVRSASQEALARLEGLGYERDARQLSLGAELARGYFLLAGAQAERTARAAQLANLEQKRALLELRVKLGDLPTAGLDGLQIQIEAAGLALRDQDARIEDASLALAALSGLLPESLAQLRTAAVALPNLPELPVGQRADLLRNRPDIQVAERYLAMASARLDLAVAEQFPHLGITAAGGFQALDAGKILDASSRTLSLGPFFSWRIFDGGRVEAEIHGAESRLRQAELAYEKSVIGALGEAERAMADYRAALEALDQQARLTEALTRQLAAERRRHGAGESSKLELLDAERALLEADEQRAKLHTRAALAAVTVVKALGFAQPSTQATSFASREAATPRRKEEK